MALNVTDLLLGVQLDTGIATAVVAREPVFPEGVPSAMPSADYSIATAIHARPDTFNDPSDGTNDS